jgi:Uma2 family endonuclease
LSPAALRARWQAMAADPLLAGIPFKLELNERGAIEVSPATTRHAFFQAFIAGEFRRLMPVGVTFTECPVETQIGVRAPDVAWASRAFVDRHGLANPLPQAPEICVEVLSPSNTSAEIDEKIAAYLAAGAVEVWLADEAGRIRVVASEGERVASQFGIVLELPTSA